MVYSNGNFVYAIGGIPVGSGSATPPPPPPPQSSEKTLWLATDNAAGVISGSAYINGTGSPVAVWSSTGSSASASVTLWPGDTVVVVSEVTRPTGYSSTIYSTGYTTSSPYYTENHTVVVSGTATYDGADSAIMSADYSAAKMIVTGTGFFDCDLANPTKEGAFPYTTPLMLYNSASSWPAANLAYKYESGETGWSHLYSSNSTKLVLSSFSALRITANANVSAKQSTANNSRIYVRFYQRYLFDSDYEIGYKNIYDTVNEYVTFAGSARLDTSMYAYPQYHVISHYSASAYVYNETWSFSGVLK